MIHKIFTEVLHKIRPANWQQGKHFFVLDSQHVDFAFDALAVYPAGIIVTYQGRFYQRKPATAGYGPGILPTNTQYWQAANPGRDLGHFASIAEIEAMHANPAAGSIATVEDEDVFYKWDQDTSQWQPISGAGSAVYDAMVAFNADLDTISAPLLFKGRIKNLQLFLPFELQGYSLEVKLAAGTTYQPMSLSGFAYWQQTNITLDATLWNLRILAQYKSGYSGETSLLLQYEKEPIQS